VASQSGKRSSLEACAKKQSGRVQRAPFLHICVLNRSGWSQYSWTECV
jgi:hypothetical protein